MKLRGTVRAVLGDNIDTDLIYPGRYLNITDLEKTGEHLFELAYPEIRPSLEPGDFIVAAKNFGCGSSREQAAAALKVAGAGAVLAASVVAPEASITCRVGDELEIDVCSGAIRNVTQQHVIPAAALDPRAAELLAAGGLVPYLKRKHVA
jgi:3-isopropylmalate/(R)-2-methylmalate dehydratase small subunit